VSAFVGIVGLLVLVVMVVLATGLLRAAPEAAFRPAMAITAVLDRFAAWLEAQSPLTQGFVAAILLFGLLAIVALIEGAR